MLPPEDGAKDEDHELCPCSRHPLFPRNVDLLVPLLPFVAYLQESLRIIGANSIESLPDGPSHLVLIVDGPRIHRSAFPSRIFDEARAKVGHTESVLEHIERNIGGAEELSRIRGGEADVGGGEGGKVLGA